MAEARPPAQGLEAPAARAAMYQNKFVLMIGARSAALEVRVLTYGFVGEGLSSSNLKGSPL